MLKRDKNKDYFCCSFWFKTAAAIWNLFYKRK